MLATPVVALAPLSLSLGTATPGGGFPAYGEAFAAVLGAADPQLAIIPRNTGGSVENVPLLAESRIDLGLVAGETAMAALERGAGISIVAAM